MSVSEPTSDGIVLVERRTQGTALAGFLALAFAAAAVRSYAAAPVAAALAGGAALIVAAVWAGWMRKAAGHLEIGAQRIRYRRGDQVLFDWPRAEESRVRVTRTSRGSFLTLVDQPGQIIGLQSFDASAVAAGCYAGGWVLVDRDGRRLS